jgi:putative transposase
VIVLARIVLRLLADALGLVVLSFRRRRSVEAENLFLRRELALYQERGVKPRRVDAATRVSLALLTRLFDWRDALVVVRPETLIRWPEQAGACSGASSRDRDDRRFGWNCAS